MLLGGDFGCLKNISWEDSSSESEYQMERNRSAAYSRYIGYAWAASWSHKLKMWKITRTF